MCFQGTHAFWFCTVGKKWTLNTSSHLTVSITLAVLRPAAEDTIQRYCPWFPGTALVTVSTDPSGPTFMLSTGKQGDLS